VSGSGVLYALALLVAVFGVIFFVHGANIGGSANMPEVAFGISLIIAGMFIAAIITFFGGTKQD
jgi:hypothetical protein